MKYSNIHPRFVARQHGCRQQGFTLLEVLIAMVVIAVGLLGLLAMQVYSVKGNDSAYLRSQATILAYDLVDTMRAGHEATMDGDYDDGGARRANWDAQLVALLGAGASATVVRNNNRVRVTITWSDDRGAVTDDAGAASADEAGGSLSFETEL